MAQCASCQFENMPGVEMCGRCGSSLRLATAVLDVHPPLARPWVKRFRRLVPIDRASHRFRERATGLREQATLVAGTVRIPVPTWDVLFRLIVPGWAHSTLGFEVRGRVFLGIYLALLLPGIIMWGSVPGSILLGLAFSTHASSVLDVLLLRAGPFPSRFGTTTIVMFVLGFFIYAPVYWLVTHVASPMTIATQMTPLEAGDIVLSNQWAYARTPPKPGDVVAYDLPTEIRMPAQNNHIGINVRSGQSIDRILAGPGSKVRWENQQLYVDDEPSSLQPLNPTRLPSRLTFEVPENHYLVLPSTATVTLPANAVLPAGFWQGLSYISPTHIHGSVYLRHYPLWRFWIVR